jgi:phosphoribosylformimino-5-aminoimidazole carboxamide ribotide isomerase
MRIIPAIDIIDGKCVRLSKGIVKLYTTKTRLKLPKNLKHRLNLHLVDLDGAKSSKINYKILEQIANQTSLKIDFGGGLKSDADLKIAFESGANQIWWKYRCKKTERFSKMDCNMVLIKSF